MHRSIQETGELIRRGELSPVELTRGCLEEITRLNPRLNAFITVLADSAIAEAAAAQDEIAHGKWRGPLHGIPIGLKDIIDTAGILTTAASNLFRDRIPQQDAPVVTALKNAGAIILGKQNLHEFAYGGSSMISCFGEMRNAWNLEHITGGSSGGSATAVAAGLGLAAIGTDTAGSIREPASQCGVVGLKPTFGRINAAGVIPLSLSLDHVGPITNSVADAALLLQVMADEGAKTASGVKAPTVDFPAALKEDPGRLSLGVPRATFFEDLDPEVEAALSDALSVLKGIAASVKDVRLDVDNDRTLQSAESYAFHKQWIERSPELYQPETLRRIMTGSKVTAAEFERSRTAMEAARRDIERIFREVDLLVTPTVPVLAPTIAELKTHPEQLRPRELVLLRNTRPWNVWGVPAISVPCGFSESGLPIGLQIAGPPWREDLVLCLAHAYEQSTAWHKREPGMASQR